ncbi:TetR/AcrR family transcriptional regulator [Nocardia sp. alder85J]|uniref:TetR/AcrR family transcriptional regulator n=1 Tax=Nocardia sp. alder85J TaxID=2862949 RepID=UPI001CD63348|nr:TetR/AcrR family transcriptional regulator [Nocardia sp. alder85J]MCX4094616.1 TetR/AcrR family transcriptional regulator [Nocardia sp. alder85J]
MGDELGLRELKKQRTRRAISEAAIRLFVERGYDNVSVVDVAAAAEVSKRTLFAYFPSKEDLVVHRFADHQDELARYVRDRAAGQLPLDALELGWLDALHRHDAATGLCDLPEVVTFYRLILDTDSLAARLRRYTGRAELLLADELEQAGYPRLTARLTACQLTALQELLMADNARRIAAGQPADDVHAEAVTAVAHAFTLLRDGVGLPER